MIFSKGCIPWNKGKKDLQVSFRKGKTYEELYGEKQVCERCKKEFIKKRTNHNYRFCSLECSRSFLKDNPPNKGKKYEELYGVKRANKIKQNISKKNLRPRNINEINEILDYYKQGNNYPKTMKKFKISSKDLCNILNKYNVKRHKQKAWNKGLKRSTNEKLNKLYLNKKYFKPWNKKDLDEKHIIELFDPRNILIFNENRQLLNYVRG